MLERVFFASRAFKANRDQYDDAPWLNDINDTVKLCSIIKV